MSSPSARLPWERQLGESSKAFAAFSVYRQHPASSRSLQKVSREVAKNLTLIKRWSARWQWVQRAGAWDEHLARTEQNEREQKIRDLVQQEGRVGELLVKTGVEALVNREAPVNANEARALIVDGLRLRRLALGLPSEIKADQVTALVAAAPDNELARLAMEDPAVADRLHQLMKAVADRKALPAPEPVAEPVE